MKKAFNIILLIFFFAFFSCKQNDSSIILKDNSKIIRKDSLNPNQLDFHQITLKCIGEEYLANQCYSDEQKIAVSFSSENISFKFNKNEFNDNNIGYSGEQGYKIYLFANNSKKVVLFDFFLENGYLLYAYFYNGNELKFLGKKEIQVNEEVSSIKDFKIQQIENELVISNENINKLTFEINDGRLLSIKAESSLNQTMQKNVNTPEKITDNFIFKKNKDGKLIINFEIFDYIQKNTSAKKSNYVIALQKYVTHQIIKFYDGQERNWTEEELIEIIAYASNTTDSLHKKYWKESPENWHNGMWGNILSFSPIKTSNATNVKIFNQFLFICRHEKLQKTLP